MLASSSSESNIFDGDCLALELGSSIISSSMAALRHPRSAFAEEEQVGMKWSLEPDESLVHDNRQAQTTEARGRGKNNERTAATRTHCS